MVFREIAKIQKNPNRFIVIRSGYLGQDGRPKSSIAEMVRNPDGAMHATWQKGKLFIWDSQYDEEMAEALVTLVEQKAKDKADGVA